MAKKLRDMTDAEIEIEIAQLKDSEAVRLARIEQRYKYRQRQALYQLRWLEKRGNELMAKGIDEDSFRDEDEEE